MHKLRWRAHSLHCLQKPYKLQQVELVGTTLYSFVTMVGMSPYQMPSLIFCEFRQLAKSTKLIDRYCIINWFMLVATDSSEDLYTGTM